MYSRKNMLFAMKCKCCKKEFVYCISSGKDFRCYDCKGKSSEELEAVEKELREMPKEEYESFMEDIAEYNKNNNLQEKKV
jgi:hypothetical protein